MLNTSENKTESLPDSTVYIIIKSEYFIWAGIKVTKNLYCISSTKTTFKIHLPIIFSLRFYINLVMFSAFFYFYLILYINRLFFFYTKLNQSLFLEHISF